MYWGVGIILELDFKKSARIWKESSIKRKMTSRVNSFNPVYISF